MIAPLLFLAAAAAGTPQGQSACRDANTDDVLVCGQTGRRYRIDPSVLEADRVRNAPPPKPQLDATQVTEAGCVGPQSCQGGVIPLVGMALVAAKAVALAAEGDDWREALRTHEDEYRLYQQAEQRRASDRKVRIGIGATSGSR